MKTIEVKSPDFEKELRQLLWQCAKDPATKNGKVVRSKIFSTHDNRFMIWYCKKDKKVWVSDNGMTIWKTDEELEAGRLEWLRKREEEKQQKFKDNVADMDKRYDALPECFRERISKFRYNNDRFRIDYEEYELFCCEQAVAIANGCKSAAGVEQFRKMEWEDQKKAVPELSDGHSGNTFGCAVHLAYWYLQEPENVIKMHGALAPLVGSTEYGCV